MARRRRKAKAGKLVWRAIAGLAALPALYLLAALIGSIVPLNRHSREPQRGVTIYLASNGIHADLILPIAAQGLDWRPFIRPEHFKAIDPNASFIAFGAGERRVYLDTPTWSEIKPRTVWSALTGGKRVMHVEYVASPGYAVREIRLRPVEYRRLWAAIRADFKRDAQGRAIRIARPGYGASDAFYEATRKQNAFRTCNTSVSRWLYLAGVKTSAWAPFVQGLTWRYREQNWLALL